MGKVFGLIATAAAATAGFVLSGGNPVVAGQAALLAASTVTRPNLRKPKPATDAVNAPPPSILTTMEEGLSIPILYGIVYTAGNIIQINDHKSNSDYKAVACAFCEGEIDSFDSTATYFNDVLYSDIQDEDGNAPSYTAFTGTTTQTPDTTRFNDTVKQAYRGIAYLSFSIPVQSLASSGGVPNITSAITGKLCKPISDLASGTAATTRSPAVILADFIINYMGVSASDVDTTSFTNLETLCDAVPTGQTDARYTFDYIFNKNMSISDALAIIESSFHGRVVRSQGTYKAVYETTGSSAYSFTVDNIVQGSLSWRKRDRKNIFRIHYLDSSDDYRENTIELRDEDSISAVGESVFEERCYYITSTEMAQRRCQFRYDKANFSQWVVELTGLPGAAKLELYNIVDLTHTTTGWTAKEFFVSGKTQDQYGRPTLTLEEYNSSIYEDLPAVNQNNDETTLVGIYDIPPLPSLITLSLTYETQNDGTELPQIQVVITPTAWQWPLKYEIWAAGPDGSYIYQATTHKLTYYINAPVETTYYVKVKSVNQISNVKSAFSSPSGIAISNDTIAPIDDFDLITSFSDLAKYPIAVRTEILQELQNYADTSGGNHTAPVIATNFITACPSVKEIRMKAILPKIRGTGAQFTGTCTASGQFVYDTSNTYYTLRGQLIHQYMIISSNGKDGTEYKIVYVAQYGASGTFYIVTGGTPKPGTYYIVSKSDI